MTATSVWLAFKAERKWVSVDANATAAERAKAHTEANHIVAAEVVHALSMVREFYYHEFIDTGGRRCVKKTDKQHFYNVLGQDLPAKVGIYKSRKIDVTREYCSREVNKYLISSVGIFGINFRLHPDFEKNYRTFKHPKKNEWFFTYASHIARRRGEYRLDGPHGSKAEAEKWRVWRAIVFYGDLVGDIPGTVRHWTEVAVKLGEHHHKHEAERLSHELGAS